MGVPFLCNGILYVTVGLLLLCAKLNYQRINCIVLGQNPLFWGIICTVGLPALNFISYGSLFFSSVLDVGSIPRLCHFCFDKLD